MFLSLKLGVACSSQEGCCYLITPEAARCANLGRRQIPSHRQLQFHSDKWHSTNHGKYSLFFFGVVRVALSSQNIYPFLGLVRRDRCLRNPILCLSAGRGLVGVSGESRQGAGSPDSQVLHTEYTVGISIGKQGMNSKDNAYCGDVTKKKKFTEKRLHVVHE